VHDDGVYYFEKEGVRYRQFPALAFPNDEEINVKDALDHINKSIENVECKIEYDDLDLSSLDIKLFVIKNKETVEKLDEIIDTIASYTPS
jgi:hypothetical protein